MSPAMVEVETRNAANTSGTTAVAGAERVRWQQTRNGMGRGEFYLPAGSTLPAKGTIMRGRCGARRFPWIVERREPVIVKVGEERREMTKVWGNGLLREWEQSPVMTPPTLSNLAETDPVLDERVMGWMGPDADHSDFVLANFIAVQGWESAFYTGEPSGWWDHAAQWVGPHSGDDENAPAGTNLFVEWVLVGEGNVVLEFAGDNYITGWFNGRKMGEGQSRQRVVREFKCTRAGWALLAFELVNAEDDGPPGGNPTAMIYTLHAGGTNPFNVFARSSSTTTYLLEYPSTIPEVPVGRQIRQVKIGNPLLDDWTVTGTETHDENDVEFPPTGVVSYRFGSDTGLDVLTSLGQTVIDIVVDEAGRTLRPLVKGTAGTASTMDFRAGYEDGVDPAAVNIAGLDWGDPADEFDRLIVRWRHGRFVRGTGGRGKALDIGAIPSKAAAEDIADALLAAQAAPVATLTLARQRVDPDDLPSPHDTIELPGPDSVDERTEQVVTALTVFGDENGHADYIIELGSLVADRATLLERQAKRAMSTLSGAAAAASLALPDPVQATPAGDSEWPIFGTGDWPMGTGAMSGVSFPPRSGLLSTLRLTSQAGASSSELTVKRNGSTVATFSWSSAAAYEVEVVDLFVSTGDRFEVDVTTDGEHPFVQIHGTLTAVGQ